MSRLELLALIVIGPPVWILAGIAGNWMRRWMGNMHLPYEERVRLLNPRR